MVISIVNIPGDLSASVIGTQNASGTQVTVSSSTDKSDNVANNMATESTNDNGNKKPVKLHDIKEITDGLNKFFEATDTNIRFVIHQKTNELMVQFVDKSNNKVLKEFPPHQFLDTIAAISDYVGILLDKKI